jgi:hypothetical protein
MAKLSFKNKSENKENQVLTFKQNRYQLQNNKLKKYLILSLGGNLILLSYLFLTTI